MGVLVLIISTRAESSFCSGRSYRLKVAIGIGNQNQSNPHASLGISGLNFVQLPCDVIRARPNFEFKPREDQIFGCRCNGLYL